MHWNVVAPFFNQPGVRWIDDFATSGRHSFTKIVRAPTKRSHSWHQRLSRTTPLKEWVEHYKQGNAAWSSGDGGCITVFPQLALTVGAQKFFSGKDRPLVAWCFNVGSLYSGIRQTLARTLLSRVDVFIVHSTAECAAISRWLDVPIERVVFVPLQRGAIELTESEDQESPFILSMGSAHRDYATLFAAVEKLGIRTVVVAGRHSIGDCPIPKNVELLSDLSHEACLRLAQQARINVVPLKENDTAAGQVTIVEAMRMGRAVVSTNVVGSSDYIVHGSTGMFVPPGDVSSLTAAIGDLWLDDKLRMGMGAAAADYAERNFSDEVVASRLEAILDRFSR